MTAILALCTRNISLPPLRTPRAIRKEFPSPRSSGPAPSRSYATKYCAVVVTRRPESNAPETMSNRSQPQNHPSVPQPRCGHRGEETPNQAQVGQATDAAHANFPEFTTAYRPNSPPHAPRTTPPEADARERALRTHSEFLPASSYRGASRVPSNRLTRHTAERRCDWNCGRPKECAIFVN